MTEDTRIAHGLGLDPVAADWPALRDEDAERVLQHYPQLGALREMDWHSPRPFSAAARVHAQHATVIVKRHHRLVREASWLEEEHAFVRHLHSRGAPVVAPLRTLDGRSALTLDDWTYEVLPIAPGHDLYRDALSWTPFLSLPHARSAGSALAALHRAAADYSAGQRQTPVLLANLRLFSQADPLAAIDAELANRPALAAYLANQDWRRTLNELHLPYHRVLYPMLARQPSLWTHNDWHASNLLWQADRADAEVASVLDFGLSDRTFALFDLATAIERNCVPWLDLDSGGKASADLDAVDALLAGYEHVHPLGRDQLQTLAVLLPLVHADFALSEIDYFEGVVGSRPSADIAYHAFLIGHSQWFDDAEGARLLAHIRRLAQART
ncbi:phosphotransferase enzyme family protein [Pseudomonas sp. LRF_L74]|uniref:phosphotransferase enzyme family protein n=1 Tax=Pseudomonas sp. LRF_L74 TaxID=3369422 RepID=UPI003F62ED8E